MAGLVPAIHVEPRATDEMVAKPVAATPVVKPTAGASA
jgi:hypothetical protein